MNLNMKQVKNLKSALINELDKLNSIGFDSNSQALSIILNTNNWVDTLDCKDQPKLIELVTKFRRTF